jgi:hypothetical protein
MGGQSFRSPRAISGSAPANRAFAAFGFSRSFKQFVLDIRTFVGMGLAV